MQSENLRKIEKIVVNVGVGRMNQQANFSDKILPEVMKELAAITGQKPEPRPAKKAIAGFKSREGQTIGLRTTLHGKRAHDFLSRVVNITLPRVKDFRGLELKNVDGHGNLNFGLREHLVFPEIIPESSKVNFGMEITVVPRRMKSRDEAIALYRLLGVPLKKLTAK